MVTSLRKEFDAAVAYLSQARTLNMRIDAGFERIQQLRALSERRTAVYGRERVRASGAADGRMDVVARIVDAERELDAQIDQMIELKEEIAAVIERVPDERMRALLEFRYLNCCTWDEVAERMNYTTRSIYNLHTAALQAIVPIITTPGPAVRAATCCRA